MCINKKVYCVVIQFDSEILCTSEVLGKTFTIKMEGEWFAFEFPEPIPRVDMLGFDKMQKPPHSPEFNVEWGHVYSRPNIQAGVKAIVCYMKGDVEEDTFVRFQDFRTRFQIIANLLSQKLIPDLKPICLQKTSDGKGKIYSGISIFITDGENQKEIYNPNGRLMIKIPLIKDDYYLQVNEITKTLIMAFSDRPISQTYMLMTAAYNAFARSDFRSAVVIGGTALEMSMLTIIKKTAKDQKIELHYPIGEMGKKYNKLKELKINIPIVNFKSDLILFRNNVIHRGVEVTEEKARDYLKKTGIALFTFEPDIVDIRDLSSVISVI